MPWKEQLFETACCSMTASQLARGSREFKSDQKSLLTCVTESAAGRLELRVTGSADRMGKLYSLMGKHTAKQDLKEKN